MSDGLADAGTLDVVGAWYRFSGATVRRRGVGGGNSGRIWNKSSSSNSDGIGVVLALR